MTVAELKSQFSARGLKERLSPILMWGMLLAFAASNTLLVKQNMELRAILKDGAPKVNPAELNLKPGDETKPFSAYDLNQNQYDLSYSETGPKRVLMFLSPDCPYCTDQAPHWRKVIESAKSGRYEVLGIVSERADRQKVYDHIKESGYLNPQNPMRVLFLPDSVMRSWKLTSTPTTLVIGRDGKVENVWVGKWDSQVASSAYSALGIQE